MRLLGSRLSKRQRGRSRTSGGQARRQSSSAPTAARGLSGKPIGLVIPLHEWDLRSRSVRSRPPQYTTEGANPKLTGDRLSDSATGRLLSDRGRFRASVVGSFPVGEPRRVVPDLLFRGGQASPSATRRSLSATPAQAIDQGSSPTPAPARPTRPTAPARAARTRAPSHRPRPDAAPPPNRSASAASAPWA